MPFIIEAAELIPMMSFCFQIGDCALLFGVLAALHSACPYNLVHHKHGDVMFTAYKSIKCKDYWT
jgi:hypothetical protein